ncbi:tetraacyldisaccharide 4'-kinase [Candidatus Latescibacterota bacterium]
MKKKLLERIKDIMYETRSDVSSLPLRMSLYVLSIVYGIIIRARNMLYDARILKTSKIPCHVISVGNIIAGGTGKTPVTIMTAKMLKSAGYLVAVVSRGYKRKGGGNPLVVSDGSSIIVSPYEAGDEPHLIASSLEGVPVVVGADRSKAAMLAFERFNPDVILLDDALQHRRIYRDADIVTMDADNPPGSSYYLPRGLLRESPYSLGRVKAVVITRLRQSHDFEEIEKKVKKYSGGISVFPSGISATGLRETGSSVKMPIDTVRGKKISAMSNIANPDSFYRILESYGAEIILKNTMPDHHRYSQGELADIERKTHDQGTELIVMTAKDERNLPENYNAKLVKTLVLDIEAELVGGTEKYISLIMPNT